MDHDDVIDQLNSFLRGELSAVETYRLARDRVSALGPQGDLARCQSSHEARISRLQTKIVELGGTPSSSSGVWGTLAKAAEGAAALFGEAATVAAIEEGEDHGRDDYKRGLEKLTSGGAGGDVVLFVEGLLQDQMQTHSIMSHLKNVLKGSGKEPRVTR